MRKIFVIFALILVLASFGCKTQTPAESAPQDTDVAVTTSGETSTDITNDISDLDALNEDLDTADLDTLDNDLDIEI